ncbi:hypothetical protein RND81_09G078800 [Saponaria officinalis]|uniref:hAT-like transposase RNase-H fold domain-containing protein n=1 Tax=Saponaria officinalis TaxID=3572 RepID=A0AAW1IJF1_SAPOF
MVCFDDEHGGDDVVTQASNNVAEVPDILMETNDNTIAAVSASLPSSKRGRKRSPVWDEFIVIDASDSTDGKERAICCHCKDAKFIANSHYGTKNLINHLTKCTAYKVFLATKGKGQIFDQNVYRDLVARAIIRHGYAFSWVEHDANRQVHTYLNCQVRTITRNTAKADCLKLHKSLMVELLHTLKNVSGRICLTSDMWTSCQTKGYLCLTAHYVDDNWKLVSKVLNFCHIETPHTGYEMYSVISDLLKKWGIESKIFSITLDNASSNDKMQDYLKESLNGRGLLLSEGRFLHVRCAAHVLNLIVQDGLATIQQSVRKIRLNMKYIKWSESRKKCFKACVNLAAISETKALWLDVPTRWNSTFEMLDRALIYRAAFKELKQKDSLYIHLPDSKEWEKIEKVRDVLEPFSDITKLFSGSEYPTSNLYFENVWRIAMLLKDLVKDGDKDIREMGHLMQEKFDKYWLHSSGDDYNTLFAFAMILDPRFKKQSLKYCYEKIYEDEWKASLEVNDVVFKLRKLLEEYSPKDASIASTSNNTNTNAKSINRKRKYALMDLDNEENVSSCTGSVKSKLDLYLGEARLSQDEKLNSLKFWQANEKKYADEDEEFIGCDVNWNATS